MQWRFSGAYCFIIHAYFLIVTPNPQGWLTLPERSSLYLESPSNLETVRPLRATPEVCTICSEWSREIGITLKSRSCQARSLLELTQQMCEGAQHANQKGGGKEAEGKRPRGKLATAAKAMAGCFASRPMVPSLAPLNHSTQPASIPLPADRKCPALSNFKPPMHCTSSARVLTLNETNQPIRFIHQSC